MTSATAVLERQNAKVKTAKGTLDALDFEAIAGKVYDAKGKEIKGFQRIWRPDTSTTLAIMKDSYKLVQHKAAMFPAIEALGDKGWNVDASHIERNGARAFVQLTRKDTAVKVLGEKVGMRILLRNTYDGSSSLTLNFGALVLACLNGAVVLGKDSVGFNSHHTGDIHERLSGLLNRVGKIEEGLGTRMIEQYSHLDTKVPQDIAAEIVKRVLGERKIDETLKYWHAGIGRDGSKTAWNLYNGVTQYLTHDFTGGWERRERKNRESLELIQHYVENGTLPATETPEQN